ncbi:ras of complex, roc, domain of DAPkinase domain-containing protein [Ditylenchus destructor]|uniref:Ras of complex, roc, domain of DAPkinase domain-containing protein n=1 Tax=Ditylenchus destructor TaxID=166010 RepID=A0AAD4N1M1_9BILA|nr:ras of complex, roc, domain of DAPkinase domain-containing protein [Ditylenchus destructor]
MENIRKICIKIPILGPPKSGKTSIANYLADSEDVNANREYRPTQGVRIVEFESNQLELEGEHVNAEVELWDCSGDTRYESCWPAIRYRSNGAIFVCNPEIHTGSDLLIWYTEFAIKTGISPRNLLVLLHRQSTERIHGEAEIADFRLPADMADVPIVPSNIERDGEELRLEFNNFLCQIIASVKESSY